MDHERALYQKPLMYFVGVNTPLRLGPDLNQETPGDNFGVFV